MDSLFTDNLLLLLDNNYKKVTIFKEDSINIYADIYIIGKIEKKTNSHKGSLYILNILMYKHDFDFLYNKHKNVFKDSKGEYINILRDWPYLNRGKKIYLDEFKYINKKGAK